MKTKHTAATLSAILSLITPLLITACGGGGGANVRNDEPAPIPTPDPIAIAPIEPPTDVTPDPTPPPVGTTQQQAEHDRHGGYELIRAQKMYDRGNFNDNFPQSGTMGNGLLVADPPPGFPAYKTSAAGKYKFWEGGTLKTERVVVGMIDSGILSTHPEFDGQIASKKGYGPKSPEDIFQDTTRSTFRSGEPIEVRHTINWELGHGTSIAGVIVAKKDGRGIHGVAYDAKIASYAIDIQGFDADIGPDLYIGRAMTDANQEKVRILNISLGASRQAHNVNPDITGSIEAYKLRFEDTIAAGKDYVKNGGVIVYAAGNDALPYLSQDAMLPHYVPELEDGFLAVVSTDLDGKIWGGSNRCGIAKTGPEGNRDSNLVIADWCIAAPGGRTSNAGEGETRIETTAVAYDEVVDEDLGHIPKVGSERPAYGKTKGTSLAAPLVSGGLAALKSLWPYMSYHDIRTRILETATDTGIWADEATYGAGLLNLEAASAPIGTTSVALGAFHSDPIVSVEGTAMHLPEGAIAKYLSGRNILVLDSFDRASFVVPATTYARTSGSRLTLDDLDLDGSKGRSYPIAGTGYMSHGLSSNHFEAWSASDGHWFAAQSRGSEAMEGVSRLIGHSLPHTTYRMESGAQAMAFGRTSETGTLYLSAAANLTTDSVDATPAFGIAGWQPESVVAASFVPNGEAGSAFGLSLATSLDRPIGVGGTGAFALSGDAVTAGWSQAIASGDTWRLTSEARIAHLSNESSALTHFDDAIMGTGQLDFSVALTDTLTFDTQVQIERALHAGEGSIHVASTIDATGRIGYDPIRLDAGDFLAYDQVHLGLGYTPTDTANLRAGVTAVRDGFGDTHAIAGAKLRLAF